MSNFDDAQDFYKAFLSRTCNYSYEVREGAAGSARAEWEFDCENTPPSQLKSKFISGLKEGADLLEKEGGYSGRKTAESIREILKDLSSIYTSDDDSDGLEEELSESSIKEIMKEYDLALAAQFVAESMTGGLVYEPKRSFSDSDVVRTRQQQYSHYCMKAKSNIASDSIEAIGANPTVEVFKDSVYIYIFNNDKEHLEMKPLFESNDDNIIIHQISLLSYMANMSNVKDINNVTNSEFNNAFNQGTVSMLIGLYTYFTIIVNKNYGAEDFNKLFVESWIEYYNNFKTYYRLLRKKGNNWKKEFEGALFSD